MRSGFAEFRQLTMKDPMEVILPLGIFAATFLVCWVARRLVLRALKAWTARTGSRMGTVLHEALRGQDGVAALDRQALPSPLLEANTTALEHVQCGVNGELP